jgi:hypothetical protein
VCSPVLCSNVNQISVDRQKLHPFQTGHQGKAMNIKEFSGHEGGGARWPFRSISKGMCAWAKHDNCESSEEMELMELRKIYSNCCQRSTQKNYRRSTGTVVSNKSHQPSSGSGKRWDKYILSTVTMFPLSPSAPRTHDLTLQPSYHILPIFPILSLCAISLSHTHNLSLSVSLDGWWGMGTRGLMNHPPFAAG